MSARARFVSALGAGVAACALVGCHRTEPPAPTPPVAEWQLLASELPAALLSVSGRSASDVYTVGADKGPGPVVLHFDGAKWAELHTGQKGDLWWVQALPSGPVLMAGAGGTVLRYDGKTFARMATPGAGKQTVYGVWGTSGESFYAVGNADGKNGFVWHFHDGAFENETLPSDLPKTATGDAPGFFKVFGAGDDVWVVGAAGAILHRKGASPFAVVPTTTKETLFTVHGAASGSGTRLLAVGGTGNGVIFEGTGAAFHDASPPAAGLLQGVFASDRGDWASGERAMVYTRPPGAGAFVAVDHGLELPAASSLHSIFVDASGGVWAAGGNVLTSALDGGMLVHYGARVPTVVIDDEPPAK
jgi:hypothetical protein